MTSHCRVAAVQMVSGADIAANFAQARPLIAEAAVRGAKLVLLPENFGFMGRHAADKLAIRERDGDGPQQAFLSDTAESLGVMLIGGSVPLASDNLARGMETAHHLAAQKPALVKAADAYLASAKHAAG